jgi:4-amino-4-deoxy-L-arabinose transferase-like glycosyltransferase
MRVFRSSTALPIHALPIVLVVLVFGVPLFLGLGASDMRNDEAIYSYAVERILETGDWLLPRTIPDDFPFLEKPPLKFWMVAAPIAAGMLPPDEFGMRAWDALFGALSFVYVFLLGRALGGVVCGGTAVLVLFSLPSLVFEHGLRSNNMEAPLLLAYCGGLYHFARWLQSRVLSPEQTPRQSPQQSPPQSPPPESGQHDHHAAWHAAIVTVYFVLGFMTKFVAAFFLPMICGIALLLMPGGWRRLCSAWRDWRWPAVGAVAISAPWFIYQTRQFGAHFWSVIFGAHVYTRMTGFLDPQHLHPWNAYFLWTWRDFSMAGASWVGIAGLVRLVAGAAIGRPPLSRMILLWWALPFVLISMGSSKIFHYAYPFLPPLALGAGWVVADAARWIDRRLSSIAALPVPLSASLFAPLSAAVSAHVEGFQSPRQRISSRVLAGFAALFLGVAFWTALAGQLTWPLNASEHEALLRNSSIVRPVVIAAVLLMLAGAGYSRIGLRTGIAAGFVLILPIEGYHRILERMTTPDRSLSVAGECAANIRRSGVPVGKDFYNAAALVADHPYYYYLRHTGPWLLADHPVDDQLRQRLFVAGAQTPIVLSRKDYELLTLRVSALWPDHRPPLTGIAPEERVVVLLPGPYAACVAPAVAAGGEEVGDIPQRRSQWR